MNMEAIFRVWRGGLKICTKSLLVHETTSFCYSIMESIHPHVWLYPSSEMFERKCLGQNVNSLLNVFYEYPMAIGLIVLEASSRVQPFSRELESVQRNENSGI